MPGGPMRGIAGPMSGRPDVFSPPSYPGGPPGPPPRPSIRDAAPVRLVYPPWVEKIALSLDFVGQDFNLVLPAVVGATVEAAVFTLPSTMVGWLQNFSEYARSTTAATNVRYTLRVNRNPQSGWDRQIPPGIADIILVEHNELRIPLPMGARVDILITNIDGAGPWTVGGVVAGWFHPEAAELRAWGPREQLGLT